MRQGDFADFAIFVAIAEEGSLRAAAAHLDLQPSTVSHGLRALESRLGVRLFHRTTRSVALTEAGQALLAQVAPALAALATADEAVNTFRAHPAGKVRLSVPRGIAACVLLPKLRQFAERFPDVQLEIAADNAFVDIVNTGFDAGVRLGGSVARDMVALRITPPVAAVVVGAPEYFARLPPPAAAAVAAGFGAAPLHWLSPIGRRHALPLGICARWADAGACRCRFAAA